MKAEDLMIGDWVAITEPDDYHEYNGRVVDRKLDIHIELPEEEPQTFHTEFPKGHAVLHGNTIICAKDEEEPKTEFKIGDKVYVNLNIDNIDEVPSNEKWLWNLYNGCIGKVVKFDGELLRIRFDNLKDAGFYPNQLKHLPKHEFKPFDKVLVRENDNDMWNARLYNVKSTNRGYHFCQDGHGWNQCIPYEGNEHLLGTTNNPKEE